MFTFHPPPFVSVFLLAQPLRCRPAARPGGGHSVSGFLGSLQQTQGVCASLCPCCPSFPERLGSNWVWGPCGLIVKGGISVCLSWRAADVDSLCLAAGMLHACDMWGHSGRVQTQSTATGRDSSRTPPVPTSQAGGRQVHTSTKDRSSASVLVSRVAPAQPSPGTVCTEEQGPEHRVQMPLRRHLTVGLSGQNLCF